MLKVVNAEKNLNINRYICSKLTTSNRLQDLIRAANFMKGVFLNVTPHWLIRFRALQPEKKRLQNCYKKHQLTQKPIRYPVTMNQRECIKGDGI